MQLQPSGTQCQNSTWDSFAAACAWNTQRKAPSVLLFYQEGLLSVLVAEEKAFGEKPCLELCVHLLPCATICSWNKMRGDQRSHIPSVNYWHEHLTSPKSILCKKKIIFTKEHTGLNPDGKLKNESKPGEHTGANCCFPPWQLSAVQWQACMLLTRGW